MGVQYTLDRQFVRAIRIALVGIRWKTAPIYFHGLCPSQEKADVASVLTENQTRRRQIMFSVVCKKCEKQFESQYKESESSICYNCALDQLRGNFAPEEGDFNSARIISGEMTEQEERWLREDLESVDHSAASDAYEEKCDEYDYFDEEEDYEE